MGQGDLAGDGQAEAGPLGLGRVERLEQVLECLGGQAWAGVGHAGVDRLMRRIESASTAAGCPLAAMA